jgi:oxygen-independent coproporphyrinogen-3 oxidase
MRESIPLSLYIHLPWCVRKCPYCDFNSHALKKALPEETYIQTLIEDFNQHLAEIQGREIISIFFGGGTPSLFSASALEKLLRYIKTHVNFHSEIEITLEANPGTVDEAHFFGYAAAGINRISLGIQSFQTEKLKALGRIHDSEAAIRAFETAKKAGFQNINIDLMHGLPNQSVEDAFYDLNTAFKLNPTHLSWYQLTLEPNTLFAHTPPPLPQDEILDEIFFSGRKKIKSKNYQHYEISAYCKQNYTCKHNLNYWEFGDYIGIGAGSHSKITDLKNKQVKRIVKIKHPDSYLKASLMSDKNFVQEEKIILKENLPFEFMLNALRLYKECSFDLFSQRTFLTRDEILSYLEKAKKENFITYNRNYFSTTKHGKNFLNHLLQIFI